MNDEEHDLPSLPLGHKYVDVLYRLDCIAIDLQVLRNVLIREDEEFTFRLFSSHWNSWADSCEKIAEYLKDKEIKVMVDNYFGEESD